MVSEAGQTETHQNPTAELPDNASHHLSSSCSQHSSCGSPVVLLHSRGDNNSVYAFFGDSPENASRHFLTSSPSHEHKKISVRRDNCSERSVTVEVQPFKSNQSEGDCCQGSVQVVQRVISIETEDADMDDQSCN